jgi:hypothetical protein
MEKNGFVLARHVLVYFQTGQTGQLTMNRRERKKS